MQIKIQVKGKENIDRKIKGLTELFKNLKPELDEAGKEMVRFFKTDVFETDGGALGENWKPLSFKYLTQKQVEYPGKGILEATGDMRKGFRLYTSAREARIRNIMPYAKYHQQPDGAGGKMPQRKFMGMSFGQAKRIGNIFERSLQERVNRIT